MYRTVSAVVATRFIRNSSFGVFLFLQAFFYYSVLDAWGPFVLVSCLDLLGEHLLKPGVVFRRRIRRLSGIDARIFRSKRCGYWIYSLAIVCHKKTHANVAETHSPRVIDQELYTIRFIAKASVAAIQDFKSASHKAGTCA